MGSISATKSTRRALLAPTSLAVIASKSVTSITRSGTTATVTCTGHGYSTNDWVILSGATDPRYNGPFQVTVSDANTFTVTLSADPGASASGTLVSQKGVAAAIWGDGSTGLAGCSLPTAIMAELAVRHVNGATGPTVAATCYVYTSDTGGPGTWELLTTTQSSTANLGDTGSQRIDVSMHKFVLTMFAGNTGQAVTVQAYGTEETLATA